MYFPAVFPIPDSRLLFCQQIFKLAFFTTYYVFHNKIKDKQGVLAKVSVSMYTLSFIINFVQKLPGVLFHFVFPKVSMYQRSYKTKSSLDAL